MTSKPKPVRILLAVAGGGTILAGGLPQLTPDRFDWIGGAVGLLALVITGAVAIYTEGQVIPTSEATPNREVAAHLAWDDYGHPITVAGEASFEPTGSPVIVGPVH